MDPIVLEVLWSRLLSVTNEQQAALMRTAFSTVVRESQDLACGVFDTAGSHGGAIRDGHARPHQRHGHLHAPLHGRLPRVRARARRRADHQRPVDDRRPDQRHHAGHADLSRRPRGGVLRQHLPHARHRRSHPVGRGARGVRGRLSHSDHEALSRGRAQRGAVPSAARPTCARRTRSRATCTRWPAATTSAAPSCSSSCASSRSTTSKPWPTPSSIAPRPRLARRSSACQTAATKARSGATGIPTRCCSRRA